MSRLAAVPRHVRVVVACGLQLLLVAGAVAPQLSARVRGDEHLLAVAPVDPIDPFRGAYVALSYPGLTDAPVEGLSGTVYVPLQVDGDRSRPGTPTPRRPSAGPYLRCNADDWQLRCGIESLFAPQDEALRLERELPDGALARVRVDARGNAGIVAVEPDR